MGLGTTTVSERVRYDIPEDLEKAANEFLSAGRRYREFLKRNHRDRLAGVVWVESEDGELVLHSEGARFSQPIKETIIPF